MSEGRGSYENLLTILAAPALFLPKRGGEVSLARMSNSQQSFPLIRIGMRASSHRRRLIRGADEWHP